MGEAFVRTGVFATPEEMEHVRNVANLPYMIVGGYPPPGPAETIHRAALAHDLPEIPGYYGMDLATGEFLRTAVR